MWSFPKGCYRKEIGDLRKNRVKNEMTVDLRTDREREDTLYNSAVSTLNEEYEVLKEPPLLIFRQLNRNRVNMTVYHLATQGLILRFESQHDDPEDKATMHLSILMDVLPFHPRTKQVKILDDRGRWTKMLRHEEITLTRDNAYRPVVDMRSQDKQEKDSFLIVSANEVRRFREVSECVWDLDADFLPIF